jgi:hypothetical protein
MEATADSTEATLPDLASLNGFSSEDLAFNQQGRLSPNQQLELRRAAHDKVFELCILVGFALLNIVVFHASPLFVIIFCAFVIYYAVRLVQRFDELQEGAVYEAVGDAWAQFVPDSEGPDRYWLHIENLKLEISKVQYLTFGSGGPYRVYYVGTTFTVIGGEVLPGWKPAPAPFRPRRHWWQNLSVSVG